MGKGLILGGTGDARRLAAFLVDAGHCNFVLSYAGVTERPVERTGHDARIGGFGGAPGFRRWCEDNATAWIINATHPFAAIMTATAHEVSGLLGIPYLRLLRPDWTRQAGDDWRDRNSMRAIADDIRDHEGRVLITSGLSDLDVFQNCAPERLIVRALSRPDPDPLPGASWLIASPSASEEDERRLMRAENVTALVTKASGGAATYGKVAAARGLALPVWRLERPASARTDSAETIDASIAWLRANQLLQD